MYKYVMLWRTTGAQHTHRHLHQLHDNILPCCLPTVTIFFVWKLRFLLTRLSKYTPRQLVENELPVYHEARRCSEALPHAWSKTKPFIFRANNSFELKKRPIMFSSFVCVSVYAWRAEIFGRTFILSFCKVKWHCPIKVC